MVFVWDPHQEALQEEEQQESDVEQAGEGCCGVELEEASQPRFTLQDLQEVLQERNELKAQLFMMQEELAYYKRCTRTHTITHSHVSHTHSVGIYTLKFTFQTIHLRVVTKTICYELC